MRRLLPPRQILGLLVAALICMMAAGVAMMARFGPPKGQLYATLHR